MESEARAASIAALSSVGLHLTLVLVLLELPPALPGQATLELEVISTSETPDTADDVHGDENGRSAPLSPGGGRSIQNVDAQRRGGGGDSRGAEAVILLLPDADPITLQDSPRNSNDGAQTQRIRTAQSRATREDRRATPNPYDQPWLASGVGEHRERRPLSPADARHGARIAPAATTAGAVSDVGAVAAGSSVRAGREPERAGAAGPATAAHAGAAGERAVNAGAAESSPGRGVSGGRGERAAEAARVAHGRPPVDEGPAATNAERRDPRVRDDTDAELLAAQMVESWVESSERSGREAGAGRGGVGGGGDPGVGGGDGAGGRAHAYGPGRGSHPSLDTSDTRYHRWYLALKRRVLSRLSFPRARLLAMDQGLSVYRFVVSPDGRLAGEPRLLRSSGYEDFDQAALTAIVEAAPFAPLPRELSDGVQRHSVRMAVEHSNPMVR